MTQHDYNIANQTFPATRTDWNNLNASVLSRNSAATPPSTTAAGHEYRDTDDDWIYRRNAADSSWIMSHKINSQGLIPQDGSTIYAADSVGTDSYAITLSPAITAYTTGAVYHFKAGTANTGAATLNVNAVGAVAIKKNYNAALEDGDILASQIVSVVYDGTNFQMLSPPSFAHLPYAADAGANDTYTATLSPVPFAYVTGQVYVFKANTANTGAATINFNSLGAKTIKKGGATDLSDNDISAAQIVMVCYDGTNMQLLSSLPSSSTSAAAQSDQETATSTTTYVSPGRQQFHPSAGKFWCNWTYPGTQTIQASYNMTSITDAGVGRTTLTIATDFSSANYACALGVEEETADGGIRNIKIRNATQAAGTIEVDANSGAGALADLAEGHAVGFGDQ